MAVDSLSVFMLKTSNRSFDTFRDIQCTAVGFFLNLNLKIKSNYLSVTPFLSFCGRIKKEAEVEYSLLNLWFP